VQEDRSGSDKDERGVEAFQKPGCEGARMEAMRIQASEVRG
jgi:hypothetical protein